MKGLTPRKIARQAIKKFRRTVPDTSYLFVVVFSFGCGEGMVVTEEKLVTAVRTG